MSDLERVLSQAGLCLGSSARPTLPPRWAALHALDGVPVAEPDGRPAGWLYRSRSGRWLHGGRPARDPELDEAWSSLGYVLHPSLAALLRVHDGLGPVGRPRARWFDDAVLPCDRIAPLSSRVRFGDDARTEDPYAWLLVAADGQGGGWCLHRDAPLRIARWRPGQAPKLRPRGLAEDLLSSWNTTAPP